MNRPAILTLFLILLSSSALRAADVKVTFVTPSIVRVQWSPDGQLPGNATGVCIYSPHQVAVRQTRENGCRVLRSSVLKVSVDLKTTAITFTDRKTGRVLLEETQRRAESVIQTRTVYDDRTAHAEQTANGQVTVKKAIRTDTLGHSTRFLSSFACPGTKALYGLGSHMEDYMNLLGKTLWLTQHNLKITIPVLVSPQGYGLLFDVGCAMKYTSSGHTFSMQMEAARQLDYYFIAGKRLDDVVGGYRYLTFTNFVDTNGLAPGRSINIVFDATVDANTAANTKIEAYAEVTSYRFATSCYDYYSVPGNLTVGRVSQNDEASATAITVTGSDEVDKSMDIIKNNAYVMVGDINTQCLLVVAKNCSSLNEVSFLEMTNQGIVTYATDPQKIGDDLYIWFTVVGVNSGTTKIPIIYNNKTVYLTVTAVDDTL